MKQYTIEISDAEDKALAHIAVSPSEWIANAVKSRCALAIDEISKKEIDRKLNSGEPISGTKEDIVLAANIESAADRQARIEAEIAARFGVSE